ncbi:hypothetical protein XAB3213_3240008 [Xanthomonas citri pv. bilvae]|nr:hypothetical protein XAB3213_3240008 [Xanthomonas citri pv. bilvae]
MTALMQRMRLRTASNNSELEASTKQELGIGGAHLPVHRYA